MAELPDVFAADDHEPMQEFGLMPKIWYIGHIKKSEIKLNSAKTGKRLNMQVKIEGSQETNFEEELNGEKCKQAGRLVFIGLNLSNPSAQCVEISQRELTSICNAVGVKELEDTEELHDIQFGFKLGVESSEGYDDKNVITKYVTEDELMEFEFDEAGNVVNKD